MGKTTMRRKNAKIRIGPDYQADIPDLLERPAQPPARQPFDGSIKVWAPTENISKTKLNEFILLSKEKHGYNTEQAMGMLYWHNYDLEKAISDLPNFAPKPDDWTPEDTVSFEAALSRYGKNFSQIKRIMPDKPVTALVKQYYLRKHKLKKWCAVHVQVQGKSSSSEHDDKMPDNSIVTVAKFFYLWKHKTFKRENSSIILNKQKMLGHSSAEC